MLGVLKVLAVLAVLGVLEVHRVLECCSKSRALCAWVLDTGLS